MNRPIYYAVEQVENGFIVSIGIKKYCYESPSEAITFFTEQFTADHVRVKEEHES